ncbi:MAG: replication-relaxation family protein [Verrucomicrobiae bacterium]|nr:replication-relaxation family protein [Verrucomicrobiae bacterium]
MPRLPRFKRSPDIPAFQLTDRDREILQHVHRHRFLRSDHLVALTTGSPQQVLRRLQRLYHHGYLERPRSQIDYYHKSGSRRIAYGLGNKGAAWLKRKLSLPFHQLDWKRKNHVGRVFLEHALLVSDIMVAVELACRNRNDVRLLTTDDLHLSKRREPFQWNVNIGQRHRCGVIPDKIFGFEIQGERCWYFLEADRATMPITRSDLIQTSFYRKLLAYEATWTQNIPRRVFAIHRFRVLTVTTNSERVQGMIAACQKLKQGRGLFLFTNTKTLQEQPDFFALHWQTHRQNEPVDLLA